MGAQSASQIAEEAMEGLDDSLQPLDDKAVIVEDDKKDDDKDDKSADDTKDDKGDDKDSDADDSDKDDDDEGYSIDEADDDSSDDDEEEDKPAKEEPKPTDVQQVELTPELRYVVDHLAPLKVRGTVADDDTVKEYTVYDPSQLPPGFRYQDDRERDIANKSFIQMENKAGELISEFRGQESQKAAKAFKEAEERADWTDIAALQKSGELPKFKVKPTDPKFDEDPASQLIDKVLDFKDELNQQYLEESRNGKPYRHIGFEDAYQRYLKKNPVTQKSDEEDKEDKDRKDLARRTRGGQGDDAKGDGKAPVLLSKRDIDAYIDSLEF